MKPKLVLFIGNGFTINFSKYLNIDQYHNTSKIIPPPDWIQEFSKTNSLPSLWTKERYPELWETWEFLLKSNPNTSFNDLCEYLAKKPCFTFGPHPSEGPLIIFEGNNPGFQLRRYLWHYFSLLLLFLITQFCTLPDEGLLKIDKLMKGIWENSKDWPIIQLITQLAEDYDLWCVSYNYDGYLLALLLAHGKKVLSMKGLYYDYLDNTPEDHIKIIYPHGSMCLYYPLINTENHRFDDEFILASKNTIPVFTHMVTEFNDAKFKFPYINRVPDFPDLVPPGHNETHLMARWSDHNQSIPN